MKRTNSCAATVLAIAIAALLASSCSDLFRSGGHSGFGSLKLRVAGASQAARTVLPPALDPATLTYDLSLTRTGFTTLSLSGVPYGGLSVASLATGTWTLAITAYNSGLPVYGLTGYALPINAGTNTPTLSLDPLQVGTGSVQVEYQWPSSNAFTAKAYWSTSPSSTTAGTDWSAFATTPFYTGSYEYTRITNTGIPSGTYYLYVELFDTIKSTTEPVATGHELVRIYDNQTSASTIIIGSNEMNNVPQAPTNLMATKVSGGVRIAWTNASNTADGFYIYRDLLTPGNEIATVSTPGLYYYDDMSAGTATHTYAIRAYNLFGPSFQPTLAWNGLGVTTTVNVSLINDNSSLSFAPAVITVNKGDGVLISTSNALLQTASNWEWSIDGGTPVSTGASYEYSFDSTPYAVGDHKVSASALYGGQKISGDLTLTINDPGSPGYHVYYMTTGSDGGSAPLDGGVYATGQNATVLGNTGSLTKQHFSFAGWTDNLAGTGTLYGSGSYYGIATSDVQLYPKWNPQPGVLSIGFYLSDPSVTSFTITSNVSAPQGTPIPIVFSDPGLSVATDWKWYIDGTEDATQHSFDYSISTVPLSVGNHTIGVSFVYGGITHSGTGKFTVTDLAPTTFAVLYFSQGATSGYAPIDSTAYAEGVAVTVKDSGSLHKDNWSFVGWTTTTDGSGPIYGPGHTGYESLTMAAANLSFYPKWVPFAGGDGSSGNPYQVTNAFQLDQVRNYLSSSFVQTADIDLFNYSPWMPIGRGSTPFTGTYASATGTIRRITSLTISEGGTAENGLFGSANGATISGLMLENVSVGGGTDTGALLGNGLNTTISKCGVSGNVDNGADTSNYIGGLVGYLDGGAISQSFSSAAVNGLTYVGGFIGYSSGTMTDCYSAGSASGTDSSTAGFVAAMVGPSTNCLSRASVSTLGYSFHYSSGSAITACFVDTGAIGACNQSAGVTNLTDLQTLTASSFTAAGWSTSIWTLVDGSYPKLAWQP
jgi:hypothetical protein